MSNNQNFAKKIILEFIDYIRMKIENDSLSLEEADSMARVLENSLELTGTADDFARFYGKSKTNVTTVIDRKMLPKPRRLVVHSFSAFRKVIPKSWVHGKGQVSQ